MLTIPALQLKRTVLFPDAFLRLDTGRIVTVGGKNLDSNAPGDSNAVGKSLLFSMIANVLYERTSLFSAAKDKKSVYSDEGGCSRLWLDDGTDQHRVEQYSDGRYAIFTNGVSATASAGSRGKDVLKIATARALIGSLFPLSENYFHQGLFLSSANVSPLIHARPADRRAFMSSIFDLDIDDLLLKAVKAARKDINQALSQQIAYDTTIMSLRKQLQEVGTPDPKRLAALGREIEELRQEREAWPSAREVENARRELERLDDRDADLPEGFDPEQAEEELALVQEEVADLRVKVSLAEKAGAAVTRRNRLATRLGLDPTADLVPQLDELEKNQQHLDAQLQALEHYCDGAFPCGIAQLETCAKAADAVLKQRRVFPKLGRDRLVVKTLETDAARVDEELENLRDELAEVRLLRKQATSLAGKESCPTCGQSCKSLHHDLDALDADLEAIDADIAKARSLASRLREAIDAGKEALSHLIFLGDSAMDELYTIPLDDLAGMAEEALKLKREYDNLQASLALGDDLEELRQLVAECGDGDRLPALQDRLSRLQRQEGKLKEQLQAHARAGKNRDKADKLRKLVAGYEAERETVEAIDADLADAESEYAALHKAEAAFSALADTLASTQAQRDECATLAQDAAIYEQLEHAYSTKGRRLAKISALAQLMTDTLNHESHLLYHEDMHFSLNIDESSYGIMVERNGNRPTDVCLLSKSERRRFESLHAFCLWKLMPSHLRPGLIILDEMEDGGSDVNKELYSKVFLPALHECIPNVFVISPLSAMNEQSGALSLTVVKEGGFSRLEGDAELFSTDGLYM